MNIVDKEFENFLDALLNPNQNWTLQDAVELCKKVEAICPEFGCHVALTGGSLYKEGPRKDCDLLFYRIRQVEKVDHEGLFAALASKVGLQRDSGMGWCHKGTYVIKGAFVPVDMFFPEEVGGDDIYVPKN